MKVSKNNRSLKVSARNQFRKKMIEEYNFKKGEWDEENYSFNKNLLEGSKLYQKIFSKNRFDIICIEDFNLLKPLHLFVRFISKIFMLIGFPITLLFTCVLYYKELILEIKFVHDKIKKIDYEMVYKDLDLTVSQLFLSSTLGFINIFLNYTFGYLFERWGYTFFGKFFSFILTPFVLVIQIFELSMLILISPLFLFYVVFKAILKPIEGKEEESLIPKNKFFLNKRIEIVD